MTISPCHHTLDTFCVEIFPVLSWRTKMINLQKTTTCESSKLSHNHQCRIFRSPRDSQETPLMSWTRHRLSFTVSVIRKSVRTLVGRHARPCSGLNKDTRSTLDKVVSFGTRRWETSRSFWNDDWRSQSLSELRFRDRHEYFMLRTINAAPAGEWSKERRHGRSEALVLDRAGAWSNYSQTTDRSSELF